MTSDLAASILARLRNVARQRGEDPQLVLVRYVNERLLYRLSSSSSAEDFVLKGATLFLVWKGRSHRVTRDLDLLGRGPADEGRMVRIFREVCAVACDDDAVSFDPATVQAAAIREGAAYAGVRVRLRGRLGRADVPVQIDIGFGDAVTPGPVAVELPPVLDLPAARLRAYPRETVIAEKVHAMVVLGRDNSRMKDFHDVWLLLREVEDDALLGRAIAATFARRATPLPEAVPDAWSDAFAADATKRSQWETFLERARVDQRPSLDEVVRVLRDRLDVVLGLIHR